MKSVLDFDNKPVSFNYNGKIYYLHERSETNSCSICCFNKVEDFGAACNEAKSELISCYAGAGKKFWVEL